MAQLTDVLDSQDLARISNLPTCISNVPGPKNHLYWRGARLEATYPVSIPGHSMALNITAHSYAGSIDIGFIGDRDGMPHLQRLAVHTGEALAELENAVKTGASLKSILIQSVGNFLSQ